MAENNYVTKGELREFFDDFKQFFAAELGANSKTLKHELKHELLTEVDKRFVEQDAKFAKRFDEQDEKLDEILNAVGEDLRRNSARVDDHESRISRLEHKAV